MSDRFPYLCLLLLLALLPTQAFAEFQPPRIIKIINASNWGGSATGEDERLYVISKGSESNVLKGSIFNVYLEKRFTYKTAAPLRIFLGIITIIITITESHHGISIGRFTINDAVLEDPAV